MPRNDGRLKEDLGVSFAIYCDENGLDRDDGIALAMSIGAYLELIADSREES